MKIVANQHVKRTRTFYSFNNYNLTRLRYAVKRSYIMCGCYFVCNMYTRIFSLLHSRNYMLDSLFQFSLIRTYQTRYNSDREKTHGRFSWSTSEVLRGYNGASTDINLYFLSLFFAVRNSIPHYYGDTDITNKCESVESVLFASEPRNRRQFVSKFLIRLEAFNMRLY